jgi:hypothetical protein
MNGETKHSERESTPGAATDREQAERSQPDPKKMQTPPLRIEQPTDQATEQPAQRNERGSPNVHMDEGHEQDPAATQGERPKFDR